MKLYLNNLDIRQRPSGLLIVSALVLVGLCGCGSKASSEVDRRVTATDSGGVAEWDIDRTIITAGYERLLNDEGRVLAIILTYATEVDEVLLDHQQIHYVAKTIWPSSYDSGLWVHGMKIDLGWTGKPQVFAQYYDEQSRKMVILNRTASITEADLLDLEKLLAIETKNKWTELGDFMRSKVIPAQVASR